MRRFVSLVVVAGILLIHAAAWGIKLPGAVPASAPASQPASGRAASPAPVDATLGDARLHLSAATLDFVDVISTDPKQAGNAATSDNKVLIVDLQITNTGNAEMKYQSFASGARLELADGQKLAPAKFRGMIPALSVQAAVLKPGEKCTDRLLFVPTDAMLNSVAKDADGQASKPFSLVVEGSCVGWRGTVKMVFPYMESRPAE